MYHLIEFLSKSKIVSRLDILHFVDEEDIQVFSVKVALSDSSLFYIRELTTKTEAKYSYHWQTARGKLLCRWDNAPHHKTVSTFPHHKHKGSDKKVLPSKDVTLEQIVNVISKKLNARKKKK